MPEGMYRIADHVICICSLHNDVHVLCQSYRIEGQKQDIVIITTQSDIDSEKESAIKEDRLEGIPPRNFSDGYLETLAVYRKLAKRLLMDNILLFHGSCISVDQEGYLFTAKSGTGKSTHTRLWREMLKNRAVMVNDDKPLLKIEDNCVTVYGTPWDGKHHLSNNIAVRLKAICILERGEVNEICKISQKEAFPMLLQQTNKPDDAKLMSITLQLLDSLKDSVELYRLRCNQNIEAAEIAYETMRGRKI